jgi:protein phosphatase
MKIEAGAYSSKGSVRPHNEDSYLIGTEKGGIGIDDTDSTFISEIDTPCLFLVADGMGGHSAGDIASSFVATNMLQDIQDIEEFDSNLIEKIIIHIHSKLSAEGQSRGTPNMGSTLTGIVLQNGECGFYNVGDSRIYRLRGGFLQQISKDDSLSNIVPGAAKNIITNAMGAGISSVSVQCRFSPSLVVPGDIFLLCSDGVHGYIADDDIEQLLLKEESVVTLAKSIVIKAIEAKSDDNCTAVVVKILKPEDTSNG